MKTIQNALVNLLTASVEAISKKGKDEFDFEYNGIEYSADGLASAVNNDIATVNTIRHAEDIAESLDTILITMEGEGCLLKSKVSNVNNARKVFTMSIDTEKATMKAAQSKKPSQTKTTGKTSSGLAAALMNAKKEKETKTQAKKANKTATTSSPAVTSSSKPATKSPKAPKAAQTTVAPVTTSVTTSTPPNTQAVQVTTTVQPAPAVPVPLVSVEDQFKMLTAEYVETYSNQSKKSDTKAVQFAFTNMDLKVEIKKNGLVKTESIKFKQADEWLEVIKTFNKANKKIATQRQVDIATELETLLKNAKAGKATTPVQAPVGVKGKVKVVKEKAKSSKSKKQDKDGVAMTAIKDVFNAAKILTLDLGKTLIFMDDETVKARKAAKSKKNVGANVSSIHKNATMRLRYA